jgi:hypothetical protein
LRNHFDYVQAKTKTYELWVATISDVIRYSQARRLCQLHKGSDNQGDWVKLTGEAPVCHAGIALSLLITGESGLQLKNAQGGLVVPVNGTYNLATGETYHILTKQ